MELSLKDTLDVALKLGDNVNFYWNFYLAVLLAAVGSLIGSSVQLKPIQKIFASAAYIAFAFLHWRGLTQQYNLLNAALSELNLLANSATLLSAGFREVLQNVRYTNGYWIATIVHIAAGIGVVVLIWWNQLRAR